jgi:hypothetical protein
MQYHRFIPTALRLLITGLTIASCSCARPEQPLVEESPKPPEPAAASAATPSENAELAKLPPPTPGDVDAAINRVFQDIALADKSTSPYFLVGDFNGDASEDLGVALKPAPGKLDQLNAEYSIWMTRDPLSEVLPKPKVAVGQESSDSEKSGGRGIPVLLGDTLFAVIHGHGPKGWRDPEATQTFLLKNVIGTDMRGQARKEVVSPGKNRPMPRIDGDVISQTLLGQPGFLYYSYAAFSYKWYDPKHYKPESVVEPFHGMKPAKAARK